MAVRITPPEEVAARKKASKERRIRAIADALKTFDALPDSAHVRQLSVEGLYCCSSATVWRHVKQGRIPAPLRLSPRITAWNVGALRDALRSKKEA